MSQTPDWKYDLEICREELVDERRILAAAVAKGSYLETQEGGFERLIGPPNDWRKRMVENKQQIEAIDFAIKDELQIANETKVSRIRPV